MTKLYGKQDIKSLLDSIAAQNRLPHAILLHGENGSGRLTVAQYIAKLFLCNAPPCESCPTCTKINNAAHPDVIFPKRECGGKYAIAALRDLLTDAMIKPNDGDIKLYIFEDADTLSAEIQNTLLKLIEEPSSHLRFIFICENINLILETIRSRVTEFEIPTPTVEDCIEFLTTEKQASTAKAKELANLTSGNIGRCVDILENGEAVKLMDIARKAAAALVKKDGVMLLAALSEPTARVDHAEMLQYFAAILRDALACRCGAELTSCGKAEAKQLATVYDEGSLVSKLEHTMEIISHAHYNLNLALTAAQLTSKLGSK